MTVSYTHRLQDALEIRAQQDEASGHHGFPYLSGAGRLVIKVEVCGR